MKLSTQHTTRIARISIASLSILSLTALALTGCLSAFGANPSGDALKIAKASPNYGKDTFVNTVPTQSEMSLSRAGRILRKSFNDDVPKEPHKKIPMVAWTAKSKKAFEAPGKLGPKAVWIGHSTMLVNLDGFHILTDPIWSERCSPVGFAGPKRYHKPSIDFKNLPRIDAVVISHDHYDHLDKPTIEKLAKLSKKTKFIVPLGVGSHFKRWGVKNVVELDWWQQTSLRNKKTGKSVKLIATPARHFSGRGPVERNKTLWASWAFVGPKHRVFFGGDTGYFKGFKKIGKHYGPFDLTIMPIGAYNKEWQNIHMNPEEALQAHKDVRGKTFIPVHWGTFNLALHAWRTPVDRLVAAMKKRASRRQSLQRRKAQSQRQGDKTGLPQTRRARRSAPNKTNQKVVELAAFAPIFSGTCDFVPHAPTPNRSTPHPWPNSISTNNSPSSPTP